MAGSLALDRDRPSEAKLIMNFCTAVFALALSILPSAGAAPSAAQLIQSGDVADRAFKPADALDSYLPAEKLQPNNVDLLLRISRQYRHLMSDTGSSAGKLKYGQMALDYDKRAAALAPNDSDAQLSSAITYGKMLPHSGKKEQVTASPLIKKSADRAIRLNAQNDNAWHVLGRWHQTLANVSGVKRAVGGMLYGDLPTGSNAESVKCFERAIAINPKRCRHHIELGRTYAQMGREAEAKRSLKQGLALPNREKDDPEIKARGRESLAKLP